MTVPSAHEASCPERGVKPRLRGVSHEYAFFVSLACGVALILAASDGRARLAAIIYAVAVSALLGTSALYHRVTWRPRARRWMRRLDHSMIFVLIAGTYTPVALLALKGSLANTILIVVWAGALGGVIFKLRLDRRAEVAVRDRLRRARLGHGGGLRRAARGDRLARRRRPGAGGLLYMVGAVVYASGRPEPVAEGVRLPRGLPRARDRRRRRCTTR